MHLYLVKRITDTKTDALNAIRARFMRIVTLNTSEQSTLSGKIAICFSLAEAKNEFSSGESNVNGSLSRPAASNRSVYVCTPNGD